MEYEEKDVVCVGITMATDYHFIKATEVSKSEKFDVRKQRDTQGSSSQRQCDVLAQCQYCIRQLIWLK